MLIYLFVFIFDGSFPAVLLLQFYVNLFKAVWNCAGLWNSALGHGGLNAICCEQCNRK